MHMHGGLTFCLQQMHTIMNIEHSGSSDINCESVICWRFVHSEGNKHQNGTESGCCNDLSLKT